MKKRKTRKEWIAMKTNTDYARTRANHRNTGTSRKNGYDYYAEGNAVRKVQVEEIPQRKKTSGNSNPRKKPNQSQRRQRVYENGKRLNTSREVRRNREKAANMNASYVFFLITASLVVLFMCVKYLNIQNQIDEKTNEINELKTQINTLTVQNDSLNYTVNSYMDVNFICKKAEKELGMVIADKKQVSKYKRNNSEYMKQIKDIPTK